MTNTASKKETNKTPLAEEHVSLGGRMVEFAGWQMPIQYEGIRQEHLHVRSEVGIFDVSHMGEFRVKGPKSLETLQWLTSNNVEALTAGKAQYSLLTNHEGGIVDDLIVYCLKENEDYLLCVNAANMEKDWAWVVENNKGADLTNESAQWGQLAIQGPKAVELCSQIFGEKIKETSSFRLAFEEFEGASVILARTGYTGEDGFEIFVPWDKTLSLWKKLFESAKIEEIELKPIGLGARDTLRTEMKLSLYGHEINDQTNPYEAALGWVVKADKKDFIGKGPMLQAKENGLKNKLVGFKMVDRGIPRQGYEIKNQGGQVIGRVTSGTYSPSLSENIGIGYVWIDFSSEGDEIFVDIRGRMVKAQVVKTPFVKRKTG